MSTTSSPDAEPGIEGCRRADVTPVTIDAESLASTTPDSLRKFKRDLTEQGLFPAELTLEASFDEDCSLATQDETDRIREYVRAGSLLGVATVTVRVDDVADHGKVRPALAACTERARRDGVTLELEGPITLEP